MAQKVFKIMNFISWMGPMLGKVTKGIKFFDSGQNLKNDWNIFCLCVSKIVLENNCSWYLCAAVWLWSHEGWGEQSLLSSGWMVKAGMTN